MELRAPWAPPLARLAAGAAALLLVGGCSASPDTPPAVGVLEPESSAAVAAHDTAPSDAPRIALRSRVTRVAGHLTEVRRERVARRVRATVAEYLDGAFGAAGHGPFARFHPGLRRAAKADKRVLVGPGVPAAVPRAAAWLSVAAPEGRPVGVTVRLRVERSEGGAPATALTGRLLLTRAEGDWQVFGYDLARPGRGRSVAGR